MTTTTTLGKTFKETVWHLDHITDEDIKWLNEIGCKFLIEGPKTTDINHYNRTFKLVIEHGYVKVYSYTEEAATMLRLKYGNDIVEVGVVYGIGAGECTLSEVNWDNMEKWNAFRFTW